MSGLKKKVIDRHIVRATLVVLFAFGIQGSALAYDYPFSDPYVATVVGTPEKYRADLPKKIPVKKLELKVFADRKMPEVLWYGEKLKYSLVAQKREAPLIFAIAGTGASYDSAKMQLFQQAFYQAGFHVVSISSPTHPNFVTAASKTAVPGRIIDDTKDLYRVMELIQKQFGDRVKVSEYYLTGYSLGAAQAAFLAKLDEQRMQFDFKKVLMINPPVSLYNSVVILDDMLEKNIPGGLDNFNAFFERVMAKFTEVYGEEEGIEFNDEFLYQIYQHIVDAGEVPKEENLAALIGMSFRLSSANMIFTSDVMVNYGYIKPKNLQLTNTTSTTDYFKVANRVGFADYLDEYMVPYFRATETSLSRQALIDSVSLKSIEDYLRHTDKIALVTNADDLILAPGEVAYFRDVFGGRAKIYPRGGHCGNFDHKDNVAYMVDYFKQ
jgi:predicted alpha/beta-fold hydrolase